MPARRIFAVLARYVSTTSGSLPSSASHVPLEEELFRHYNPKAYYPVNPGDVFHDSYKTVVKLGFGSHSTVWLAKDLRKYFPTIDRKRVCPFDDCIGSLTNTSR